MKAIVSEITLRDTGTAHLYHQNTGYVVASPQWTPDPVTEREPMKVENIALGCRVWFLLIAHNSSFLYQLK